MGNIPESTNTKKLCVFCGNLPNGKTKEHVLPRWLIEFTGDPNRTVTLGWDLPHFIKTGELKERKFALSAFQFPACDACNSAFSKMESTAKLAMHKLFDGDSLDNGELTTLLDWFDKVRMGLWLAFIRLDDISEEINPRLYIKTRQKQKDRALLIYDFKDSTGKGLGFSGVNSPIFYQLPSCFALRINSKLFLNVSADFLTSKNLGFIYGSLTGLEGESLHQAFSLIPGTRKATYPVVEFPYAAGAAEIYQTVFSQQLTLDLRPETKEVFINDTYLLSNCLLTHSNEHVKVSKIFYKKRDYAEISTLQVDEKLDLQPAMFKSNSEIEAIIQEMVSEIQVWLFRRRFPTNMLPESKKEDLLESQASTFRAQRSYAGSEE
jgi:hypothetical protein